ncbi:transposase [Streptomyces sp. ISL-1]|uniref:transposase n=1 Tax=Streptomyces sp. ISL-1 TaxID=2817657 RepID=UPI0027E520A3|nr:transposase [Streptomyces sp. ISL-1]
MRVLRLAKESAVKARTQAMNQLKAVLLDIDPDLRDLLTGLSNPALVATCAALVDERGEAVFPMRLLALRIQLLSAEVKELTRRTTKAVRSCRPQMLDLIGVGPDSAAVLLIAAGDNPDRLTDEASFAAHCGVSPVEQSSGKTQRRRLNRGGNRQANAALYRIVMTRIRWDERTQAYLQRRTAEGMSKREIIRCLKRYVARELYQHIQPAATAQLPSACREEGL